MPNWFYLVINFLFHLGLAIWIGGAIALGALVAPALFKALPREQAGAIFGPTLRRFARLRILALALILAGAAAKYFVWERHAATPWIALRWAGIAFLAFAVAYEVGYLERAMAARDAAFATLHRRAEVLMKSSLAAALIALFFS
jgi:uncharacterized membrane protein